MMKMSLNPMKTTVGLALFLWIGACAPNVATIDRTQPNGIDKAQFEGIWYYRAGIIDTDAEAGDIEGITSSLDKVRFEITEDRLIAYRSYEFVPYAEGLTDDGRDFFGSPVGAWAILKHFDIQREYNPTTGVETNVIVENDTDRPWFERKYIRVNWADNVVGTPTLFTLGFTSYPDGALTATAIDYYSQGDVETDPNRPIFTDNYFDITNTYHVEPDAYYCNYTLLYNGVTRCGAGTVKARLAFRKIDPKDDYESLYYPDVVELKDDSGNALMLNNDGRLCSSSGSPGEASNFDPSDCEMVTYPYDAAFGNFRILRTAFDHERYLTRTGRVYLAGRFDLWDDSYEDTDGSLKPYTLRKAMPIIYYGNPEFPDELVTAAQKMTDSWAVPFEDVVAFHQNKLTADGQPDREAVQADLTARGLGTRMVQFRQNACNPKGLREYVESTDGGKYLAVINRLVASVENITRFNVENLCAAVQYAELQDGKTIDPAVAQRTGAPMAFTWQRLFDLRYNFQNYLDQTQPNGPWGVAQFATDPETGEYISNVANYFAAAGDSIAQSGVDTLQWLNGDLDESTFFRGDVTRAAVASRPVSAKISTNAEVKGALMAREASLLQGGRASLFAPSEPGAERDRLRRMFGGSAVEREFLVTDDILRTFAGPSLYQPSSAPPPAGSVTALDPFVQLSPGQVTEEALEKASPVNWGLTQETNEFEKIAYEFGRRAFDLADFFDPNMSGLAEDMKGKSREEIYDFLRYELYAAVNGHEVGHTLGLRHNFEGSIDALNYQPEFWHDNYWQPENQSRPDYKHRGNEYKYASIMDYGFDLSLEGLHGVGRYDEAALRFMYGQIVHVWDPKKVSLFDPRKYGSWARRCGHSSDFFGPPALLQFLAPESIPKIFGTAPAAGTMHSDPNDPNSPLVEVNCARRVDETCNVEYGSGFDDVAKQAACESPIDAFARELVVKQEAAAASANDHTACGVGLSLVDGINTMLTDVDSLPANAANLDARILVPVSALIQQKIQAATDLPEFDDPNTDADESRDYVPGDCTDNTTAGEPNSGPNGIPDAVEAADQDGDGVPDDKGFDWTKYMWSVDYRYCSDLYAGYSYPYCQRWDTGWDLLDATNAHVNRYDRDYIFSNFRRDALGGRWGSPNAYMSRLLSRRLFHMTSVFRFYLYSRNSAIDAPLYHDWAEATYRGVNLLERILQTPEPGTYCLDTAKNEYVALEAGESCPEANRFEVGLGYGQGKYLNTSWTNEYDYKANRIGVFYDKVAALYQLTTSSGVFYRDVTDIFDRSAFSLGYHRVYLDPMLQRFASLVQGDHTGYEPRVVTSTATDGTVSKSVRYMPFFDESERFGTCESNEDCVSYPGARCDKSPEAVTGECAVGSVRTSITNLPKIKPSWSYNLSYYALLFSLANWSSINDYAPEMYRFTKISIKGTPEDVAYGPDLGTDDTPLQEYTDPETLITYRAPIIRPRSDTGVLQEFPGYYGDPGHRSRGEYRNWGVGANLLADAKKFVDEVYVPAKQACGDPASCDQDPAFQRARQGVNARSGFIDIVRKFNRRAELSSDY